MGPRFLRFCLPSFFLFLVLALTQCGVSRPPSSETPESGPLTGYFEEKNPIESKEKSSKYK